MANEQTNTIPSYKGIGIYNLQQNEFAKIKTGASNLRESLTRILFTRKGTRPGVLDFGTDIPNLAFTQDYEDLKTIIESEIVNALGKWEPRIEYQSMELLELDSNFLAIKINFINNDTLRSEFLDLVGPIGNE